MRNYAYKNISAILIFITTFSISSYGQNTDFDNKAKNINQASADTIDYEVTFIEIGSLRCTPCKEMQPIMKSIEEKYRKKSQDCFL